MQQPETYQVDRYILSLGPKVLDSSTNQNTTQHCENTKKRVYPKPGRRYPKCSNGGLDAIARQVERGSRNIYRALRANISRKTLNRAHGLEILLYADTYPNLITSGPEHSYRTYWPQQNGRCSLA